MFIDKVREIKQKTLDFLTGRPAGTGKLNITIDIGFKNLAISLEEEKISFCIRFRNVEEYYCNLALLFEMFKEVFSPTHDRFHFFIESQFKLNNIKLEMFLKGVLYSVFRKGDSFEIKVFSISPRIKKSNALKFGFEYQKIRTGASFKRLVQPQPVFMAFLTDGWHFALIDMDKSKAGFSSDILSITPSFADYIDTRLLLVDKSLKKI